MASLRSLLLAGLASTATAQIDNQLVGTWSTKSAKVLTGPVCSFLFLEFERIRDDQFRTPQANRDSEYRASITP